MKIKKQLCGVGLRLRLGACLMVIALVATLVSGCSSVTPATIGDGTKEDTTFKLGMLPLYDVLPWAVGEKEGIFEKAGVKIELVAFRSAADIDTALLAGEIDAGQRDIIAALLMNKDKEQAKILRLAMGTAATGQPIFGMVTSGNSNIRTVADLKGQEIAIASNTIIDYLTDKMLLAGGVSPKDVKKQNVPQIPLRLELLQSGQVKAATLPEPVLTQAIVNGARLIIDDSASKAGQSALVVSAKAIKTKPNTLKKTLAAYEQAVDKVNANPEQYRALLVEVAKVPDTIQDKIKLPKYPKAAVPSKADVEDVNKWMMEQDKEKMPALIPYEKVVDASFLPK